jgi:protein TonB
MSAKTLAAAAVAVAVHAALLLGGGRMLARPAEYGVEVGVGGVEVELVAAPAGTPGPLQPEAPAAAASEPLEPSEPPQPMEEPKAAVEDPPAEDSVADEPAADEVEPDVTAPASSEAPAPEPPAAPSSISPESVSAADPSPSVPSGNGSDVSGDGSSPVPGRDATTLRASGGATAAGTAAYLRNPAPRYPVEARMNGQQGVVLLRVRVSPEGRPLAVDLARGCGYPLLDRSALQAVRRWRFLPAHVGGLPVESEVEIPIRFVLD